MLEKVKLALRVSTDAFDTELNSLIESAKLDLNIIGVEFLNNCKDPLLETAIITYVKCHFGEPSNYADLKQSYDEQKAQLQISSLYKVN